MPQIELKLCILVLWLLKVVNTLSDVILFRLENHSGFKLAKKFDRGQALIILEVSLGSKLQDTFDHFLVESIVLLVIYVSGQRYM